MALRSTLLAVILSLAALSQTALAEPPVSDPDRARELAGEALDLMRAHDLDAALAKFKEADALLPVATIRFEIASILEQQGKLQAATEAYRRVIATEILPTDPEVHQQARERAIERLRVVLADMPRLTVELVGQPGAVQLTVDGEASTPGETIALDPGQHTIVVRIGAREIMRSVNVARGEAKTERITVDQPVSTPTSPPATPETPRQVDTTASGWVPLGWSLLAVGAGGFITLGVAGGIAVARQSDLEERCGGFACPAELSADVARYDAAKLASIVGLVVGVSGVVLAVPALVIGLSDDDDGAALLIRPGAAQVRWSF